MQPIVFAITALRNRTPLRLQGALPLPATKYSISGVTKDSTGAVIAGCNVSLFRTIDNLFMEMVTSDASGNFSFFTVGLAEQYYVVAYKAGSPDVAGTTANTLVCS